MKWIPWIISLVIISTVFYFYWYSQEPAIRPNTSTDDKGLTATLLKARLVDFQGEKTNWIVNAQKADLFENQKLILLLDVYGHTESNQAGGKPTRFRADNGRLKERSKRLIAWGNVEIEFNDGQKLLTQKIIFDHSREIIYNRHKVLFESKTDTIHADSMHYNLKSDLLTLRNPKVLLRIN